MNEIELKDFLKDYVEILKTNVDISKDLPLSYFVSMPSGCIEISTCNGERIIFICIDEKGGPSMPIGPIAMTYARLIVTLLNKYYEGIKNER